MAKYGYAGRVEKLPRVRVPEEMRPFRSTSGSENSNTSSMYNKNTPRIVTNRFAAVRADIVY